MPTHQRSRILLVLISALALATSCASSKPDTDLTIDTLVTTEWLSENQPSRLRPAAIAAPACSTSCCDEGRRPDPFDLTARAGKARIANAPASTPRGRSPGAFCYSRPFCRAEKPAFRFPSSGLGTPIPEAPLRSPGNQTKSAEAR